MILSKFLKPAAILLGICILVSGCATSEELTLAAQDRVYEKRDRLFSKPACCSSFEDLSFQPVSSERITSIFGSEDSKVFEFDSGKSYFLAVELPEINDQSMIVLKSDPMDRRMNTMVTLVSPHVLFLDSNFRQLQGSEEVPICFYRGWTEKYFGYFGRLGPIPDVAEYAILFTDTSSIGGTVPYSSSATTAGGGFVFDTTVEHDFPKSPEGVISIWVAPPDSLPRGLENKCLSD